MKGFDLCSCKMFFVQSLLMTRRKIMIRHWNFMTKNRRFQLGCCISIFYTFLSCYHDLLAEGGHLPGDDGSISNQAVLGSLIQNHNYHDHLWKGVCQEQLLKSYEIFSELQRLLILTNLDLSDLQHLYEFGRTCQQVSSLLLQNVLPWSLLLKISRT